MADEFVLVPVTDPMIGTTVGSFIITRLLGRGGMGAVYLAQHKAAPKVRRVFKTVLAHLAKHPMLIQRLAIEAEAVGRLEHENIVELKDFGVLPNNQTYLEFEFIDGVPLDRFLAEYGGRLSLHRAAYLVFQVCDALDHAHEMGVIHRDLKPDNLLIVVDDKKRVPRLVKIVDFGISKVAHTGKAQTMSGMSMGTPLYMSVEQYANAAEASPKSDVFSLAIILWSMLTGDLPWGHPEQQGVLYHLQQTEVPTPPSTAVMPAALARLLLRCLSVDPDLRPTMREFAIELAAVVPATEDAPSGGAILQHIARRFLTAAPDHARTVPNPAVANPDGVAAQLWPPVQAITASAGHSDGRLPPLKVETASSRFAAPPIEHAESPAMESASPSARADERVSAITAHDSPRALVASAVPGATPHAASQGGALASSADSAPVVGNGLARGAQSLPAHVIAAFPTGLQSERYVAQNPLVDAVPATPRIAPVASEIALANGTPGPEPFAHAELPPVLLSNTQLTGINSGPLAPPSQSATLVPSQPAAAASAPASRQPFASSPTLVPSEPVAAGPEPSSMPPEPQLITPIHEPLPMLVLPKAMRAPVRGRRFAAATGVVFVVAVAGATFALFRREQSSPAHAEVGSASATTIAPSRTALSVDAGAAVGADGPPGLGSATGKELLAPTAQAIGQPASRAAADAHGSAESSARIPRQAEATSGSASAATVPQVEQRGPSVASGASRMPPTRPATTSKPLRVRQQEARQSNAERGNLHLLVTPWAVCTVDGERVDQTPCLLDDLPVGRYRVRLENSVAHKVETITVTVTAGSTQTIERTW